MILIEFQEQKQILIDEFIADLSRQGGNNARMIMDSLEDNGYLNVSFEHINNIQKKNPHKVNLGLNNPLLSDPNWYK